MESAGVVSRPRKVWSMSPQLKDKGVRSVDYHGHLWAVVTTDGELFLVERGGTMQKCADGVDGAVVVKGDGGFVCVVKKNEENVEATKAADVTATDGGGGGDDDDNDDDDDEGWGWGWDRGWESSLHDKKGERGRFGSIPPQS